MRDSFRFQLAVILLWMRLVSKGGGGGGGNIKALFCSALKLPRLCGITLVNQVSLVLERSRWRDWTETGVKTAWQPADFHWHFVEIMFTNDTFSRKDTSISHHTEVTELIVAFQLSSSTILNKAYVPYHITMLSVLVKDQFSKRCKYLPRLCAITNVIFNYLACYYSNYTITRLTVTWHVPAKLINKDTISHNNSLSLFWLLSSIFWVIIIPFLSFSIFLKETVGVSPQWQTVRFDICVYPLAKKQTSYIYSGQTRRREQSERESEWERERERENKKLQQL